MKSMFLVVEWIERREKKYKGIRRASKHEHHQNYFRRDI